MRFLPVLLALLFTSRIFAADVTYQKGKDASFVGGCVDATEREDGTTLLPSEVQLVRYYIDNTAGNMDTPLYTAIMSGGCKDTMIDLGQFPTDITFYSYAQTVDTEDRVSVSSYSVSFIIVKGNPNAPGQIK